MHLITRQEEEVWGKRVREEFIKKKKEEEIIRCYGNFVLNYQFFFFFCRKAGNRKGEFLSIKHSVNARGERRSLIKIKFNFQIIFPWKNKPAIDGENFFFFSKKYIVDASVINWWKSFIFLYADKDFYRQTRDPFKTCTYTFHQSSDRWKISCACVISNFHRRHGKLAIRFL